MTGDSIYPGVIVEEQAGVRHVPFLPPAPPLFVGEAAQGPLDRCGEVASAKDFATLYGSAARAGELQAAVALCLANAGGPALVLRVAGGRYRAAFEWLERVGPRFGLLVLPAGGAPAAQPAAHYAAASELCRRRRAILLLDPPADWGKAKAALVGLPALTAGVVRENAALYLPRLKLSDGALVGSAGAVAGAILHNDRQRGVWQAPAGLTATLSGVVDLAWPLSEGETASLSSQGVNAIRLFAGKPLLWGALTLAGADAPASQWKHLPLRRLALAIEESLEAGLRWVASETNGEPLWAAVRAAAGALLQGLFRAGAFAGQSERDAWFLRCDTATMTAADVAAGRLNLEVGFAPQQPAKFVVLRLSLWTREADD